jgi:ribosomal-protein-serine acetyltransferase
MFAHPLGDGAELARLEPWHAEEFLETLGRARAALAPTIPHARRIHTLDEARAFLQRFADGHARDTEHLFGVWQHGTFVGVAELFAFDTAMATCELGVWLEPDAQGQGLITRACRYLIDWAIRVRGMRRVQWTNDPTNLRSAAVARRLGMTREGLLRSSFALDGERWDNEVWSVISEEWPTALTVVIGSRREPRYGE